MNFYLLCYILVKQFSCKTENSRNPRKLRSSNKTHPMVFDHLSDNNVSNNGLSFTVSVAVNKQISEVILTPGNDAILVAY